MEVLSLNPLSDAHQTGASAIGRPVDHDGGVFQLFLDMLIQASGDPLASPSGTGLRATVAQSMDAERHGGRQHGEVSQPRYSDGTQASNPSAEHSAQNSQSTDTLMVDKTIEKQLRETQGQMQQLLGLEAGVVSPYVTLLQKLSGVLNGYVRRFDPSAFVQNLEHFRTGDGKEGIRMTLWPEHLGKVEVTLLADGRHLQLNFAGSPEFQQYVREQWGDLEQILAQQGYQLASQDFGRGGGGQNHSQAQAEPAWDLSDETDMAPEASKITMAADAAVWWNINNLPSHTQVLQTV